MSQSLTAVQANPANALTARVNKTVGKLYAALDRCDGLTHTNSDGAIFSVRFASVTLVNNRFVVFEVDMQALWHIPAARLRRADVLDRLAYATRVPIRVLEHDAQGRALPGVVYVADLVPQLKAPLPVSIALDLAVLPARGLNVIIGYDARGPIIQPLHKLGHILVGGMTGSGKSNWLQALLLTLLSTNTPDDLQLVFIDPKRLESVFWENDPHLFQPIAHTLDEATRAMRAVMLEVERRERMLSASLERSVESFNAHQPNRTLPALLAAIDEFLDLAEEGGPRSEFYSLLVRNANRARAVGVRFVLCATNPKSEVMNTSLRGACSTRIAFRVREVSQSRTILDATGAEQLPAVPGRMLACLPDRGTVELQAPFVSDEMLRGMNSANVNPTVDRPVLSELQSEMVRYAVESLKGTFPVKALYERFKGRVSWAALKALASKWESSGWLMPGLSVTASRQVSDELAALSGLPSHRA